MSPPSAWPRELVVEARRTLLAMPVALNDAVSAGDFPGMLLDSREGIYVASFLVAALVPFVRRLFVDLVAEVREKGKGGERTRKKMMRSTPRSIPCLNINLSLSFSLVLFTPPPPLHTSPLPNASCPGTSPSAGSLQDSPSSQSGKVGAFLGVQLCFPLRRTNGRNEGETLLSSLSLFPFPLSSLSLSLAPTPLKFPSCLSPFFSLTLNQTKKQSPPGSSSSTSP